MESKSKKDIVKPNKGYMTQQEIADGMGVTRAMVHLIEKRAIRKIRQQFEMRGWKFEDFTEK